MTSSDARFAPEQREVKDQVATIIAEAHQQADGIQRRALSHSPSAPSHSPTAHDEVGGKAAGGAAERDPVLWGGDGRVELGGEEGDAARRRGEEGDAVRRRQGTLLHVPRSDSDFEFVGEFVVYVVRGCGLGFVWHAGGRGRGFVAFGVAGGRVR